jgi:hypothetical protein
MGSELVSLATLAILATDLAPVGLLLRALGPPVVPVAGPRLVPAGYRTTRYSLQRPVRSMAPPRVAVVSDVVMWACKECQVRMRGPRDQEPSWFSISTPIRSSSGMTSCTSALQVPDFVS